MRNPAKLCLAAAMLIATVVAARAQTSDPAFDPLGEHEDLPKLISVQAEFIEVPHATLTRVLSVPRVSMDDTALRKTLADLTAKGEATVVETMLVIARSGQKATSESIKEYIYPTEYEPAGIFNLPSGNAESETPAEPQNLTVGPTPTAFEARHLGSTFEIEPILGESGKIIDLRFVPEITYHTGNTTWAEWKDERGDASIRMPTIYTARFNTSIVLMDGQPLFVAALSPKGPDGMPDLTRKLMVFVRCDVLRVGR